MIICPLPHDDSPCQLYPIFWLSQVPSYPVNQNLSSKLSKSARRCHQSKSPESYQTGESSVEPMTVYKDLLMSVTSLVLKGPQLTLQISHLSDERLVALTNHTKQFQVGTLHRARVIGHSPMDGVVLLSFEQKVLDQVFMQVDELKVGQVLKVC
jgi:hypothetical protein